MCYNSIMNAEADISVQSEYDRKPTKRDIVLYVVLSVFLLAQTAMLVFMPVGKGEITGFMLFLILPITNFWWRLVILFSNPEKELSKIKRLKEQGWYHFGNNSDNPRMTAKERFKMYKLIFPIGVVVLSLCLHAITFLALKAKFESSLPSVTTHSITGFAVYMLMLALIIYIKLRWAEKLFGQKRIITTGLIYQNMLLALMLLVR